MQTGKPIHILRYRCQAGAGIPISARQAETRFSGQRPSCASKLCRHRRWAPYLQCYRKHAALKPVLLQPTVNDQLNLNFFWQTQPGLAALAAGAKAAQSTAVVSITIASSWLFLKQLLLFGPQPLSLSPTTLGIPRDSRFSGFSFLGFGVQGSGFRVVLEPCPGISKNLSPSIQRPTNSTAKPPNPPCHKPSHSSIPKALNPPLTAPKP